MDKGATDKQDIYTKVVDDLGVPRPTVRRVARDLRNELLAKVAASKKSGADHRASGDLKSNLLEKVQILQSGTAQKTKG